MYWPLCLQMHQSSDSNRSPSEQAAQLVSTSSAPRQINDHVWVVDSPPPEKRPSVEIVFFHGLQLEESKEAHITTWLSRGGTQLWLNWILEEKGMQDARILTVSYDAHPKRTNKEGRMRMYVTGENLLGCLVEGNVHVGQDGCPVILVGHCSGGLVMKELCLQAQAVTLNPPDTFTERVHNFLDSLKGMAFYATPHHGTSFADVSINERAPLLNSVTLLDNDAAVLNEKFRVLRHNCQWKSIGFGETSPVNVRKFNYNDVIVEEGSARHDVDKFYTVSGNHFDICRPESRTSSSFVHLMTLITDVLKEDEKRDGPKLLLPDQIVGIDHQVENVIDKLVVHRCLGISGMGGLGKTTLAKTVFNAISKDFEYACFLCDVNKCLPSKENPESLRTGIKEELYFRGRRVRQAFDWSRLKEKKVLVVADAVTADFQLGVMNLIAKELSAESRFIVTTRNKQFLRAEKFEDISVLTLKDEHPRTLFCMFAFQTPQSMDEKLINGYLHKCGGHPLALEISGRHLNGLGAKLWEEGLENLSKALPINGDNTDALKIICDSSYVSLGKPVQQMFLDIAHCFHGERLSTAKRTWELCGWKAASAGFRTLLDRGLVTEVPLPIDGSRWISSLDSVRNLFPERDSRHAIQMHQCLRDYGRNTEKWPELKKVDSSHSQEEFPMELWKIGFNDWKVRILPEMDDSENPLLDSASHSFPTGVSSLHVTHLHRWISSRIDKALSQTFPRPYLKCLEIVNCSNLVFLPSSLGQLQALEHLTIENCRNLECLPESLGQLQALEHLNLLGCDSLETLPSSLGHLCSLQYLAIERCGKLGFIPDSCGKPQPLEHLSVQGCNNLRYLPDWTQLPALEHLIIKGCHSLKYLDESLGKLGALKYLAIEECSELCDIPVSLLQLGGLEYPNIQECHSITILDGKLTLSLTQL
ncbi:unnamed protein product [Calypogeia fissa]